MEITPRLARLQAYDDRRSLQAHRVDRALTARLIKPLSSHQRLNGEGMPELRLDETDLLILMILYLPKDIARTICYTCMSVLQTFLDRAHHLVVQPSPVATQRFL